jgi:hypothetical protein
LRAGYGGADSLEDAVGDWGGGGGFHGFSIFGSASAKKKMARDKKMYQAEYGEFQSGNERLTSMLASVQVRSLLGRLQCPLVASDAC